MDSEDASIDSYIEAWQSKMYTALLDYTILSYAALHTDDIWPYRLHQLLKEKWGNGTPHLQTIYSTINKLEENGFIDPKSKIVNGRVNKILSISDEGWELMEHLKEKLKSTIQTEINNLTGE